MKTISEIRRMLEESRSSEVIAEVNSMQTSDFSNDVLAQAYYMRGNAYRQQGNMRMAMNSYLESMELQPDGPAAQAYRTIQEILNFYDHDLYNP